MGGGLSAPRAPACCALSRAGALPRPRRRRRAAVPATGRPVVARRYAPRHRSSSPSAGAAGPSSGAWHCLSGQDHRQGRSPRSRRHGDRRKRRPLSSDLPRKDHRHLSGWTEPPVDSVRPLVSIETPFHCKFLTPNEPWKDGANRGLSWANEPDKDRASSLLPLYVQSQTHSTKLVAPKVRSTV
jgi:hypothetical protein